MGDPQNGWFIVENPINMDDDLGILPFVETPICIDMCVLYIDFDMHLWPQGPVEFLTGLGRFPRFSPPWQLSKPAAWGCHSSHTATPETMLQQGFIHI